MSVLLLRHGQTDRSVDYVASGRKNREVPLNQAGLTSALQARSAVQQQRPDALIYSNFTRTAQTGSIVLPSSVRTVRVDSGLDEVDYGQFDGGPWLKYGEWLESHGLTETPPGAQQSWMGALQTALLSLARHHRENEKPLVVCHGFLWAALADFVTSNRVPLAGKLATAPYCQILSVPLQSIETLLRETETPASSCSPVAPGPCLDSALRVLGFERLSDRATEYLFGGQRFLVQVGDVVRFANVPGDLTHPDLRLDSGSYVIDVANVHNVAYVVAEAARFRKDL